MEKDNFTTKLVLSTLYLPHAQNWLGSWSCYVSFGVQGSCVSPLQLFLPQNYPTQLKY